MRINYITYKLTIINDSLDEQILSHFNGSSDLIETTNSFCYHIIKNIRNYTDNVGKKRSFTLSSFHTLDKKNRNIYGYFDSAFSGEKLKIKEKNSNKTNYTVSYDELQSRNFFFLIHVPKNSKYAYLVIQKKANHGIQIPFTNAFNQFLKLKGFMNHRLVLTNAPSYNFLIEMMELGDLKEIKLIKNSLGFSDIEQLGNSKTQLNFGSFEKVIKLKHKSNTLFYKNILYSLFDQKFKEYDKIQIEGIHEEFDEISFRIVFNKTIKTYYIKNKHKIKSNIDITDKLTFKNGEPTKESLINTALNLINTINNNQKAA